MYLNCGKLDGAAASAEVLPIVTGKEQNLTEEEMLWGGYFCFLFPLSN